MPDNGNPPGGPKRKMKKSTTYWLIGGGVIGLIAVYYYMSRQSSSSSNSAQQTADLASQGIDPNTGIPYSQEYGSGLGGAYGTTPSMYGYYDPTSGQYISGTAANSVVTQPSTNASWAQEVEAYMQNLGYNPTAVAAALGKYLTGQPLTANQRNIVAAALGFFGNPPTGAPPIQDVGGGGSGQGGGGTGGPEPPIVNPGGPGIFKNRSRFINVDGKRDWFSAAKDTLDKVKLNASGWYHINGQKVYYDKAKGSIGFRNNSGKWVRRSL